MEAFLQLETCCEHSDSKSISPIQILVVTEGRKSYDKEL